ncbi:hypothetical protein PI27_gp098 [Listeria phage WIL-1]|uniref:hypothetical protein n=1 Tax=Listeria phage WIL-1 TaxID=1541821 RepID=UPI00248CC4C2|nr:hypothetical protein PI27_gp098 [Listeria phage WIL-1]
MMTIEQKLAIITTMGNAEGWDTDYRLHSLSKTVAVVNQLEEGVSEVLIDSLTPETAILLCRAVRSLQIIYYSSRNVERKPFTTMFKGSQYY